jgi:hypothetical protein
LCHHTLTLGNGRHSSACTPQCTLWCTISPSLRTHTKENTPPHTHTYTQCTHHALLRRNTAVGIARLVANHTHQLGNFWAASGCIKVWLCHHTLTLGNDRHSPCTPQCALCCTISPPLCTHTKDNNPSPHSLYTPCTAQKVQLGAGLSCTQHQMYLHHSCTFFAVSGCIKVWLCHHTLPVFDHLYLNLIYSLLCGNGIHSRA